MNNIKKSKIIYKNKPNYLKKILLYSIITLFIRAIIDFMQINYINVYFNYDIPSGLFDPFNTNWMRIIVSYVIIFFIAFYLLSYIYSRWRPSQVVLVLYFVVVMIPLSSLYGLANASTVFFFASSMAFAILISTAWLFPINKIATPSQVTIYIALIALIGISLLVYGELLLTGGLNRMSFNLLSVYNVRFEYVERTGSLMGYLVPWQGYVINIIFILYGLQKRKWFLMVLAGVSQLLLFGMTGLKAFLLVPFLATAVWFLFREKKFYSYIAIGTIVIIMSSYTIFLLTENHLWSSLFIRRLFFVPAINHFVYYDFFSKNPFVMLSHSILSPFVHYPYSAPLTRVISWAYWGREFGPNVGYLADAFANFGFIGMFLFSIILGLFLRTLDAIVEGIPANFAVAIISVPGIALINSALFTSLLTHGFILAAVLLWLFRALEENKSRLKKIG